MFSHISAGPRFRFSIVVKDNLPSTRGLIALLAALICNEIQKLEALEKMEVEGVNRATDLLKAMSHPCRLIILHRLAQGSCKADELQKLLFLEQAIVAQHLARLRFGRIIVGKKIGKTVHYELTDKNTRNLVSLIAEIFGKSDRSNQTAFD